MYLSIYLNINLLLIFNDRLKIIYVPFYLVFLHQYVALVLFIPSSAYLSLNDATLKSLDQFQVTIGQHFIHHSYTHFITDIAWNIGHIEFLVR